MRAFRALAVLTFTAAGCSDREASVTSERPAVVIDSAGVRIVRNTDPAWRDGVAWTVSQAPVLRIGMVDGPTEYLFDRIAGMTRLSDGAIVVLDAGAGELRYYSGAGLHLRSAGRTGEGPGELRAPRYLERVAGDVVQVTHTWGRTRYGADGRLVSDDRIDWNRLRTIGRFLHEACPLPTPMFVDDSTLLCESTNTDARALPPEPGHHRSEALVATAPWTLERADTLSGRFLLQELYMQRHAGRLYPVYLPAAYGRTGVLAVGGRPRKLVYAPSDAYRIERYEIDGGALSLVVERTHGMRAVGESDLAALERMWTGRYPPFPPDEIRSRVPVADSVSVASAVFLDDLNVAWVRIASPGNDPGARYDVFAEDGLYLGQLSLPAGLQIYEIGRDYILGRVRDDDGVEYAVMFSLDRTAHSPSK